MKFHMGKIEYLILFLVMIYISGDVLDITQYGILNHLNIDLLSPILTSIFIFFTGAYYNYSFYKNKKSEDDLNENYRFIFESYKYQLLKYDFWLYTKFNIESGIGKFQNYITEEFIQPPKIAREKFSIIGAGKKNIVIETKNIFLDILYDNREGHEKTKTYYIINRILLKI